MKKREKNANQIVGKFTNSEGNADNRTDNQEVEQSSRNNVHLEQLIDNCTPVEEGPIWFPNGSNENNKTDVAIISLF